MCEVRFDLDSPVKIAKKFSINKIEEYNLLIIPDRPTWMVLSDEELAAFNQLIEGKTLRKILDNFEENLVYSVLSKIEQAHFYVDDISAEITSVPPELVLNLTNRCNLKCVHCYADAGNKFGDELTTEQWLNIIDQYSSFVSKGFFKKVK